MTKKAKPGSLEYDIESRIKRMAGYEDLDVRLRATPIGKRADHTISNGEVIVEQKLQKDSPQQREKGRQIMEFSIALANRLGVDHMTLAQDRSLWDEENWSAHQKLQLNFADKIKDNMDAANKQIASTKILLKKPNAKGVLLLIFDEVSGMMPIIVEQRVKRCFQIEEGRAYPDIDLVVYYVRMKDLLYKGHRGVFGHQARELNSHRDLATQFRNALRGWDRTHLKLAKPSIFDIQQAKKDIFD